MNTFFFFSGKNVFEKSMMPQAKINTGIYNYIYIYILKYIILK